MRLRFRLKPLNLKPLQNAGIAQLVEHNLAKVGVASSNLVSRSNSAAPYHHQIRGNSSAGRAQPCQGWGREFESRFPLQIPKKGS